MFEKLISGQYRQIDFSRESTGNHQILRLLCYLLSACLGRVVIIDEADSGVHDYLFLKVFQEINPHISGQVIMTTHNTMLMEADFARDATYILYEEDAGHKVIKSISDYPQRTYLANNIRSKYMEGKYGGLPNVTALDFKLLIQKIEKIV
jgi:AAA15 family ATPase/GTPase